MKDKTLGYIEEYFSRFPQAEYLKKSVAETIDLLCGAARNAKILLCGNGGSAADCEHVAGELLKGFESERPLSDEKKDALYSFGDKGKYVADNLQQGICCIPLVSFSAAATAFLNDCKPDLLFAQLVNSVAKRGDVLLAFSTSGNSENVINAAIAAKANGVKVVALTGKSGGKIKDFADILLNVPAEKTYLVQEMHLPLYHLLCHAAESELFGE